MQVDIAVGVITRQKDIIFHLDADYKKELKRWSGKEGLQQYYSGQFNKIFDGRLQVVSVESGSITIGCILDKTKANSEDRVLMKVLQTRLRLPIPQKRGKSVLVKSVDLLTRPQPLILTNPVEVTRAIVLNSQPALQEEKVEEENEFDDELSTFAKRTNFDDFECLPYILDYFTAPYEDLMERFSQKLKARETLTESETSCLRTLRRVRHGILCSWKNYLEEKHKKNEHVELSDRQRKLFASNWETQKKMALLSLPEL